MTTNKTIITLLITIALQSYQGLKAQEVKISSPNQLINVSLQSPKSQSSLWSLAVSYKQSAQVLPQVELGLLRADADFAHQLKLKGNGAIKAVHDDYVTLHGKKV